jgi:hypothetical protein
MTSHPGKLEDLPSSACSEIILMGQGKGEKAVASGKVEFGAQVAAVGLDCQGADREGVGDFPGCFVLGD